MTAFIVTQPTETPTVATPTFSPAAGTYSSTQTVTVSCATPGASIYYTTDGSTPTTSSTPYTAPISVSRSETLNAIGALMGYNNSLVGTAIYTIGSTGLPVGMNLDGISYYSPEQPFMNLMKSAGTSASYSAGWYTSNGSTWDTGEEGYVQLDSNGYPTSLTASPTPSGGQQFTFLRTLINYNLQSPPPGASYTYPPGTYRLKFIGQGTVVIGGDAELTLTNSSSETYVSANFIVTSPGSNSGLTVSITAINSDTDYPRDISVVLSTNTTSYDAGGIFNPSLLAYLAPFQSLRFMDWGNTNGQFTPFTVASSTSLPQGATSSTLSSIWTAPSMSQEIIFIDGTIRTASFTIGSATFTWSGGIPNAITSTTYNGSNWYCNFWAVNYTWANRPLPSNCFWPVVPLEIMVALANTLNTNAHICIPMNYADSDIESWGQLIMSGTGMQSGFSPMASNLTLSCELGNEVWNYGAPEFYGAGIASVLGELMWPSGGGSANDYNRNWYGMRTAQMADDLQTAVGATLFERVIPVLGAQAGNTYSATESLSTPYWTSGPASNYPIKAIAIAPYWGGNPSATDCATMLAVTTPLDDFFATLTSQTGTSANGSKNYSSVPTGGWLGQGEGYISSFVAIMSSYPSMKLICYEGGQNFFATSSGTAAGWPALVTSAERDTRMGTAYIEYLTYWADNAGATTANINNIFADISPIASYGAWGLCESIMQTINPLSSAPAKYQGVVNYIDG